MSTCTDRWLQRASRALTVLASLGSVAAIALAMNAFREPTLPETNAAGDSAGTPATCALGARVGATDFDDSKRTDDGLPLRVRTPRDYDPTRGYPLLVVYPPAGMSRAASERFYGLTGQATARGFIVAYSDHIALSRAAVSAQAKVAAAVMRDWCVKPNAVAFIGHSDGGSIAEGSLISPQPGAVAARAIVASAAGIEAADLAALCRSAPVRIMVVHSRDDEHFPGFGRAVAAQWAAHEGCSTELPPPDADGCSRYVGCREGSRIDYCETTGAHTRWPALNDTTLAFIEDALAEPRALADAAMETR